MVLNNIDCVSGDTDITAAQSPEENSGPEVSIEEFSSYFHHTGEIKSLGATLILPKTDSRKNCCMVLKNIQNITWPNILKCHYHDIYYNLNSSCEELEARVYNLVKFDTQSLSCKQFEETSTDCIAQGKEMDCNKKGNICELFSLSPERRKKFKQIQRCNISSTLQIRQIAIAPNKKKNLKKCVKGYSQSSLKLNFNPTNNSTQSSPHPFEPNTSLTSCRKSLFKTQVQPQAREKTLNWEICSSMPADWSIKKNRFNTAKDTKPTLTLNPEKCLSPSNQNKYKLSLRKGLQRSLFLKDDKASRGNSARKEPCSSSPERKSFCRFDSMSSEDMEVSGKTEKLSDKHRKKLREAVANALENHGIKLDHPLFKSCGRNLFSICKSHLKDVLGKGRTSIQMKQLADSHVEKVVKVQTGTENL